MNLRVGNGYDVHRLVENKNLILGGEKIPFRLGLLGHSDADVLIHAIMDSLLGAIGSGDIGKHFPDTDDKYKNVSSLKLLFHVYDLVKKAKYKILNIDSTIIAQKPKIVAYIPKMKENIAKICDLNINQINIKATTEEGLGFTGNMEGIAVHAVCLVEGI